MQEWFGSNDPVSGTVRDGRWAYTRIPYLNGDFYWDEMIDPEHTFFPTEETAWMAMSLPHLQNPYGLLRSPWNYNPSPYLTRFNNVNQIPLVGVSNQAKMAYMGATCADYTSFVQTYAANRPYSEYLYNSEDAVHGNVHFAIGGAGGNHTKAVDDLLRRQYNLTEDHIVYVARAAQKFFKTYVPLKNVADPAVPYPIQCTADPWQDVRHPHAHTHAHTHTHTHTHTHK